MSKGDVMERADVIRLKSGRTGADGIRPAAEASSTSRQEPVDAKAFKGKGPRARLRHLQAELAGLEAHMDQLVAVSRSLPAYPMFLTKHRHRSKEPNYVFLRWREAGGAMRHLGWEAAIAARRDLPRHVRLWYAKLDTEAIKDNAAHVALCKEIRSAMDEIARQPVRPVYPRPIRDVH